MIVDVVRRYAIDGVHLDDYFYPYPIKDEDGNEVPFPDDESFAASQTDLDRADWRRQNIDRFIQELYKRVKSENRNVLVGISPFGIWRPGHPESVRGFDAYDKIYADARKWLHEGWVDYLTPQLYWKAESPHQSYPELLQWWVNENRLGRAIWPGNFASRVGMEGDRAWPAEEIVRQIEITRDTEGAGGNVLFSMKSLFDDYGPLGQLLGDGPYARQAIIPNLHAPQESQPEAPIVSLRNVVEGEWRIDSSPRAPGCGLCGSDAIKTWEYQVLPGAQGNFQSRRGANIVLAAVDRTGTVSKTIHIEVD